MSQRRAGMAHLDTYLHQVQRHLHRPAATPRRARPSPSCAATCSTRWPATCRSRRIEAALADLGAPREVARLNVTERVAAELETNRSPLSVLRGVGRLAGPQPLRLLRLPGVVHRLRASAWPSWSPRR